MIPEVDLRRLRICSATGVLGWFKLKAEQDMDVKKQELDLNKQEQEQMVESENQQRDMLKQTIN